MIQAEEVRIGGVQAGEETGGGGDGFRHLDGSLSDSHASLSLTHAAHSASHASLSDPPASFYDSHATDSYTSLSDWGARQANAVRRHECFLCSPFYGRACRWARLGEIIT